MQTYYWYYYRTNPYNNQYSVCIQNCGSYRYSSNNITSPSRTAWSINDTFLAAVDDRLGRLEEEFCILLSCRIILYYIKYTCGSRICKLRKYTRTDDENIYEYYNILAERKKKKWSERACERKEEIKTSLRCFERPEDYNMTSGPAVVLVINPLTNDEVTANDNRGTIMYTVVFGLWDTIRNWFRVSPSHVTLIFFFFFIKFTSFYYWFILFNIKY